MSTCVAPADSVCVGEAEKVSGVGMEEMVERWLTLLSRVSRIEGEEVGLSHEVELS